MKKYNKELDKLIDIAEDLGWKVEVEEETENHVIFDFGKYSPEGQDFHFSVEAEDFEAEYLKENIYSVYSDYDVSAETYIWLDSDGHGTNGAPYDMKDVYEDMAVCQNMILELYNAI